MNRSQRWNEPEAVTPKSSHDGDRHRDDRLTPKYSIESEMPMNSVMMIRKLSRRIELIETLPQRLPESLADETAVTDAGHRAETYHHLLVDDEHRDQERQRPEQRVAEVLTGLGVGRDAAGVVVAHHDDESRSDDRQEREEACSSAATGPGSYSLTVPKAPLI
jgi:hypothetical protein